MRWSRSCSSGLLIPWCKRGETAVVEIVVLPWRSEVAWIASLDELPFRCLYNKDYKDNDKASNHIELKSDNPEEEDICKDFLKLAKEVKFTKEKKNFFVHYHCVEETSWKSDTFSSLFEKYRKSVDEIENKIEDKNDLSNVELYLVCIHRKNKSASTYHFSLADLKDNYTVGTKYSDLTDKSWLNEKIFNTEN